MNVVMKILAAMPITIFLVLGWISYSLNNVFMGYISMLLSVAFVVVWAIAQKHLEDV